MKYVTPRIEICVLYTTYASCPKYTFSFQKDLWLKKFFCSHPKNGSQELEAFSPSFFAFSTIYLKCHFFMNLYLFHLEKGFI